MTLKKIASAYNLVLMLKLSINCTSLLEIQLASESEGSEAHTCQQLIRKDQVFSSV